MLTYKQFMLELEDDVSPADAEKRYECIVRIAETILIFQEILRNCLSCFKVCGVQEPVHGIPKIVLF